jgi:quercetin dioxygenase-like cupin family protein
MRFSFFHAAQQQQIHIPQIGLSLRVLVPPHVTGTALTAIETTNAPGFGPPLHRHRETELFYVLEGRYLFDVDGRRFLADAGDAIVAPGGCAHTFVNVTSGPARQFIQILPGLDAAAFFLGLGDVMAERVCRALACGVSRAAPERNRHRKRANRAARVSTGQSMRPAFLSRQ